MYKYLFYGDNVAGIIFLKEEYVIFHLDVLLNFILNTGK